ncbi:MAG TPA: GTPase Era [Clostridia bacterium]|nr:GTPase Era [Clostridia bacterium]
MAEFRSGFVTIIGRPNVGKSTLLNRMVGQKVAIMSDKPQTTRNKIQGVFTHPDYQIVFIDTPGIHKPKHKLGEYMVEQAKSALAEVDCVLYVYDITQAFGTGEEYILQLLETVETPVLLVINKIDLVPKETLLPFIQEMHERFSFREIVPVSAVTGENIDRLLEVIKNYLPEGPQYYPEGMVTDQPEQFIMAEIIREKVLQLTREEVPHSVAVKIEELIPRSQHLVYVGAVIYLERESQKGIIIGKQGQMLKQIGQLARQEIESLLGGKIYLDLRVKVKPSWRRREEELKTLGYVLEKE